MTSDDIVLDTHEARIVPEPVDREHPVYQETQLPYSVWRYATALHNHYMHGGRHPHDYNIPLNQWDAVEP